MEHWVVGIFILGYLAIALEHNLKIDKLIPALAMMALAWVVVAMSGAPLYEVVSGKGLVQIPQAHGEAPFTIALLHHLGKTSEILFFLIGAMTIVEIIDEFKGFGAIKQWITTSNKRTLLIILSLLAFVLSAIIDNLTTTIVLITILRKLVAKHDERIWYVGMIIIAANAGGAWSPIGDVTTTMLWIAHKVSADSLVMYLFLPSLITMLLPLLMLAKNNLFNGHITPVEAPDEMPDPSASKMLFIGLGGILFVPIFKMATHLPPYVGMMLSLAMVATVAEVISMRRFSLNTNSGEIHHSPVHKSLSRIETPSILFFLGILLAVAAMESLGVLVHWAQNLQSIMSNDFIAVFIGFGSALIDNVPLVAAAIGMFSESPNAPFWHFIAYTAGTGGSMLIIGSAAGVVAMGMEKINFFWYFKNISWLALLGYIGGVATFLAMRFLMNGG